MADEPEPMLYDETIASSPETIDAQRILLHAERLVPTIVRSRGQIARITRNVVMERRQIEVEVAREELTIDYERGDGTAMNEEPGPPIVIVLHEEEIVISKRVRAVEEVVISTRRVTQTRRFDAVVRHEVLDAPEHVAADPAARMSSSRRTVV